MAEAKQVIDEGLTIQRRAHPENHPDLAASQSVLGECLTGLSKYTEAEPLLLKSYERLKAVQGEAGDASRQTLACIIKLYDAWNAAEPGKGHDEKAAEWRGKLKKLDVGGAAPDHAEDVPATNPVPTSDG